MLALQKAFAVAVFLLLYVAAEVQNIGEAAAASHGDRNSDHRQLNVLEDFHVILDEEIAKFDPNGERPAMKLIQKFALGVENGNQHLVKKTSFGKSRLFFVAGLEGSGHHAIKSALDHCLAENICNKYDGMTNILFRYDRPGSTGLFGGHDTESYDKILELVYHRMKALRDMTMNLPDEDTQLFFVAMDTVDTAGMMSFPNYNDKETKAIDHPDLLPLAILADAAGVDLRIVVTQRNARDTLHSAVRRQFGGIQEPQILLHNAQVLSQQLQLLDPAFLLCMDYDRMMTFQSDQLKTVREFLQPRIDQPFMEHMWASIRNSSSSKTGKGALPAGTMDMHHYSITRLELELQRMRHICPPI